MSTAGAWTGLVLDERYHLTHWLGQGAFGSVYEAEHRVFGQLVERVAIKLIHAPDDRARDKILAEMRAVAALSHPHLIGFRTSGVLNSGPLKNQVFLACELAKSSLETYLESQHFTGEQALLLAREMAMALEYLARRHMVHRDLKPANILRVYAGDPLQVSWAQGSWKIADFGLSRALESQTHISGVAGTLSYLAPEAARGHVVPANDCWALGALLQESVGAKPPFALKGTPLQMLEHIARHTPHIETNLPSPLREIIAGCLQIDPSQRWTPTQILAALDVKPPAKPSTAPPSFIAQASHSALQVLADTAAHVETEKDDGAIWVGPRGYATIAEAIENAPDGATIRITRATYCETLVLDKTLHLIGEDGVTIEGSAGNVCKISGGQGSIANCELRGVASRDQKRFHAVSANGGQWTLRDCRVSCDTLCAVVATGDAELKLENCLLHQSLNGLLVSGTAHCHSNGSRMEKNRRHGVLVQGMGAVHLHSCALEHNAQSGARVESGVLEAHKCTFSYNAHCGLEAESSLQVLAGEDAAVGGAQLQIGQSFLQENREHGVRVDRHAAGEIVGCVLSSNRFGAWNLNRRSALQRHANREGS